MKKISFFCAFIGFLWMETGVSEAAVKFVRPGATGTNDGSTWTNAYASLPANLARGDTYYLADGNYGSYIFDDANNGTTVITIKKATTSDHGTDAGWSSAYGDGQAIFSGGWWIYTDYYTFDGQTRNANWRTGAVSEYGIKVVGAGSGNKTIRLDNGGNLGGDNLTFRYVDIVGAGRDTGFGDDVIYGLNSNSNLTFQYCSLRDSDRTIFLMRGNWQNLVVDHSYMARNTSNPSSHGELLSTTEGTNITFSNNALEDIEGTAIFAILNNGTAANWKIYGNTAVHTAAYIANTGRGAHNYGLAGFILCANDAGNNNICNNFQVYNNTLINIQGVRSGVIIEAGTGNIAKNNLWYNSINTESAGTTLSYNWYYNTVHGEDSSGTTQVCTSNCNVFVDLPNRDFHLKTATTAGMALAAPYDIDPDSKTRGSDGTFDRGAFEYGGTSSVPPQPVTLSAPSSLRIVP